MPRLISVGRRAGLSSLTALAALAAHSKPPALTSIPKGPSTRLPQASTVDSDTFLWRDRGGVFHYVTQMETRHLYFTLTLIWNQQCPPSMRLPGKHYDSLGDYYTKAYLGKAAKAVAKELETRKVPPALKPHIQLIVDKMGLKDNP